MYKICLSFVILCLNQNTKACGRDRGGGGNYTDEVNRNVTEEAEGYIFHGENKTATFPYKHLKGNDSYCQSQCDIDTSCNGFSINTSNLDCFISACDTPITILSCFTCYFASKNPPLSDVVCPLNHTTTFTQTTIMAEFNTNMSQQTTETQRTPIKQSATLTQDINFEQSFSVTQRRSSEENTTESQAPPYEQATTVSQQPSIEQPTNVTALSITGQPTTATQKSAYDLPTTVTQQPTIEEPVTSTYHHTEQPTAVSKRSTLDQSTTVTQNPITQGSTIEQSSNITMTHHLDMTRIISSTPVTTFKQWLTYAGFTSIESTTNANSVDEVIDNYETIFATNNSHCVCICKTVDITLEESIEKRRKGLIVNKTGLSSNIRKLTSAKDYRVTSQTIGTVAIIIMTVVGVLFFAVDIGVAVCMRASKITEKSTAIKPL